MRNPRFQCQTQEGITVKDSVFVWSSTISVNVNQNTHKRYNFEYLIKNTIHFELNLMRELNKHWKFISRKWTAFETVREKIKTNGKRYTFYRFFSINLNSNCRGHCCLANYASSFSFTFCNNLFLINFILSFFVKTNTMKTV